MSQRFLMWVLAPLLCGAGAAIVSIANVQQPMSKRTFDPEKLSVEILVARKNLDLGEFIKDPADMFEVKTVTWASKPHDACLAGELMQTKGWIIKRPIRAGDSLCLDNTYLPDKEAVKENANLALSPGYRAVWVEFAPGEIWPDSLDRIDIFHTPIRAPMDTAKSKLLLSDVLVFSNETRCRPPIDGQKLPGCGLTVVLATLDAMNVTVARETGSFSYVIRSKAKNVPNAELISSPIAKE